MTGNAVKRIGLIPARAGKTEIARAEDVNANGSSPRGRGKRRTGRRPCGQHRLIPARAGKTTPPS